MTTTRTLDAAAVLAHAPATVRKLVSRGNAHYTFRTTMAPDEVKSRKATAAERKAHGSEWTLDTPEAVAGRKLRALNTNPDDTFTHRGFREANATKLDAHIGQWVRIGERVGQVWSVSGTAGNHLWVAMGGTEYAEVHVNDLDVLGGSESDADALFGLPVDDIAERATEAQELAARAESTGRDGVEFVRNALGDDAVALLAVATDVPAPTKLSQHGPVRSNATCVHCGVASGEVPSVDEPMYGMADARWDAVLCVGAHCLDCTDNDAAQWYGHATHCAAQREAGTYATPIGPVVQVRTPIEPATFAQRMHAMRRRHHRLAQWRAATVMA